MTYKELKEVIDKIDRDSKEIHLSLGVVDYEAPYLLHYRVSLLLPPFCNAKHDVYDFLIRVDMLQTVTLVEQKK